MASHHCWFAIWFNLASPGPAWPGLNAGLAQPGGRRGREQGHRVASGMQRLAAACWNDPFRWWVLHSLPACLPAYQPACLHLRRLLFVRTSVAGPLCVSVHSVTAHSPCYAGGCCLGLPWAPPFAASWLRRGPSCMLQVAPGCCTHAVRPQCCPPFLAAIYVVWCAPKT